jgi:hypothetical protein
MTEPAGDRPETGAPLGGMIDAVDWPQKLTATVIEPGEDPRIHGYAIESDLARNYGSVDILYLALTGELPSSDLSRGFEVAMSFLACVGINEGPTHAAFLARLCNAPARAVLQVAAVALAERASFEVQGLLGFLAWLETATDKPPSQYVTDDPAHARSIERLRAALPTSFAVPPLSHSLTRPAAIAAVLHACGLRRPEQFELVWMLAAVGPAFAEGMTAKPLAFREYPMDIPAFRYRGDRER